MPFKFNPLTGELDQIEGPEFPDTTGNVPESEEDGFFTVSEEATDGKVYWFIEGKRYEATGTLEP